MVSVLYQLNIGIDLAVSGGFTRDFVDFCQEVSVEEQAQGGELG